MAVWTEKSFIPLLMRPQGSQGRQKSEIRVRGFQIYGDCMYSHLSNKRGAWNKRGGGILFCGGWNFFKIFAQISAFCLLSFVYKIYIMYKTIWFRGC